jgi:predicted metal-binding protein
MANDAHAHPVSGASHWPEPLRPGWKSIVLVCKACEKRSKGPRKITAREVARQLKKAAHEARVPRARIVMTSCMSACPKKAFTVAAASPGGEIEMVAFHRGDDPGAAIALLFPVAAGA